MSNKVEDLSETYLLHIYKNSMKIISSVTKLCYYISYDDY